MRHGPCATVGLSAALAIAMAAPGVAAPPPQAGAAPQVLNASVRVAPESGWVAAGLSLLPGDTLTVRASGGSAPQSQRFSRAQVTVTPDGVGKGSPAYPLPAAPAGALIGRIGDGPPFKIGTGITLPVSQAGPLQLRWNIDDRTAAALKERRWAFTVDASVVRPPPPPPPPPPKGQAPGSNPQGGPSDAPKPDASPSASPTEPVPTPPTPPPAPPRVKPTLPPVPPPLPPEPETTPLPWPWLLIGLGLAAWLAAAGIAWGRSRAARLARRTARLLGVSARLDREDEAAEVFDAHVEGPAVSIRARLERGEETGHG